MARKAKWLGLLGTYAPLILPRFFGAAFFIFMLRQLYMGLPNALADATRVDGAGACPALVTSDCSPATVVFEDAPTRVLAGHCTPPVRLGLRDGTGVPSSALVPAAVIEKRSGAKFGVITLGGCDLVRLGLSLYGADPARRMTGLRPVLSASARIVQLREVPPGTRAGYGGRWRAARTSRLAVLPVGYADGYSWHLSHGADALVGGRRVPLAGAVSMDMVLLDVTDTDAVAGDVAVLLGRQGEEEITLRELADRAGTVRYELLCLLGQRQPRRYLAAGNCTALRARLVERVR